MSSNNERWKVNVAIRGHGEKEDPWEEHNTYGKMI